MLDFPISITADLFVIGAISSNLAEFLRGLILKIEDYPRVARSWKYVPSVIGMISIALFPNDVKVESILVLFAHGAISPAAWIIAHPLLKALWEIRVKAALPGGASPDPKKGES